MSDPTRDEGKCPRNQPEGYGGLTYDELAARFRPSTPPVEDKGKCPNPKCVGGAYVSDEGVKELCPDPFHSPPVIRCEGKSWLQHEGHSCPDCTPPIEGEKCRARAEGGSCVLPRGHNQGQADIPANHSAVEGEDERVWTIGKWGRTHSLVISGPDTGPGESSTEVVEVVPASLASQLKAERDELKAARGTIRATVEQELHELTTRAEAAEARIAELEAEKEKLAQELSDQANALADEYRGEEVENVAAESYLRGWAAGNKIAMNRIRELENEVRDYLELIEGQSCDNCDGGGEVMRHNHNYAHAANPDGEYDAPCGDCNGTGKIGGYEDRIAKLEEALKRIAALQVAKVDMPGEIALEALYSDTNN